MRGAGASPLRIALLGYGAMGASLAALVAAHAGRVELAAAVVREAEVDAVRARLAGPLVAADVRAALGAGVGLVVECAGHGGLRAHGRTVLAAGVDLLVASVGALADADLEQSLRLAAGAGGARVLLPSGALGGLDVLAAARHAGLDAVTYTGTKAPAAWRGTAAERAVDLDRIAARTEFFRGSAREAALTFPQNANVAAAVALAGVGFERTRVTLAADPGTRHNRHRIEAQGAFGSIDVQVEGRPLATNPKTSMLAPYSLLGAMLNRGAAIALA